MKTAKSDLLIVNNNRARNRVLNPASRLGFISNSACGNLFLRLLAVFLFNYIEVTDFFQTAALICPIQDPYILWSDFHFSMSLYSIQKHTCCSRKNIQ